MRHKPPKRWAARGLVLSMLVVSAGCLRKNYEILGDRIGDDGVLRRSPDDGAGAAGEHSGSYTDTTFDGGAGSACSDGPRNGAETNVDCGGGTCAPCPVGDLCSVPGDCATNLCQGGVCAAPPSCSLALAVDMGVDGNVVSVPNDGCIQVTQYPVWWAVREMRLDTVEPGTYPVPFTWSNTCAGGSGSDTLTADWQNRTFGPTSDACATLIDLQGAGNGNVSLRYFNP